MMDRLGRNVVPNHSRTVRTKLMYSSNKENSDAPQRSGKSNVKSLAEGKLTNQEFPSRKSITRRLSFPKHDDSVQLMTFEEAEETTKIPIKHEINFHSMSNKYGKVLSTVEHPSYESKSALSECKEKPDLPLSKETIDYLRKISAPVQASAKLSSTSKCSNVKDFEPASIMEISLPTILQENIVPEKSEGKNIKDLEGIEQLLSRHSKQRQELQDQWIKEYEELRKKHEEELKAILYPSKKEEITQFADSASAMKVSQGTEELNQATLTEDFIVNTPISDSWMFSKEKVEGLLSSTPTLRPNDTLENMTLNKPPSLETPATRRLVAKRIMNCIETLFKE